MTRPSMISFRDTAALVPLSERGDAPSLVAKHLVRVSLDLLPRELYGLNFTPAEAALLSEAVPVERMDAEEIVELPAAVRAFYSSTSMKRHDGVDRNALMNRLEDMTPMQRWAILDGVLRYWHLGGHGARNKPDENRLRAVNLIR